MARDLACRHPHALSKRVMELFARHGETSRHDLQKLIGCRANGRLSYVDAENDRFDVG